VQGLGEIRVTEKQREVLAFIVEEYRRGDCLPTQRELSAKFGWSSKNTAVQFLYMLVRHGALRWRVNKARAYSIVLTHPAVVELLA
jgi:SOS-response transcriptional repressor LexA